MGHPTSKMFESEDYRNYMREVADIGRRREADNRGWARYAAIIVDEQQKKNA